MTRWNDEHIIAYLDGKLDMAQGQALHRDRQFDPELDAYVTSLEFETQKMEEAGLEMLKDAPAFSFDQKPTGLPLWKQAGIAASIIGLFALGFLTSLLLPADNPPPQNWVQAVAEYQMLYTGKTLEMLKKSDDQAAQEVAEIGRKLGLILTRSDLDLEGLDFKRGQLLRFKNKPLVQFAFLDKADGEPIAFCIIQKNGKANQATKKAITIKLKKMVAGQNAAVWSDGKFGFVVIGKKDSAWISEVAEKFKAKMMAI